MLKVTNYDLNGMIQYQRDSIRKKKFDYCGRVLSIAMGIDRNAAYTKGAAFERVKVTSGVMGLTIEWNQFGHPYVAFARDRQTLIFPDGINVPPTVSVREFAHRFQGQEQKALFAADGKGDPTQVPLMKMSMLDFASGRIGGKDGSKFACLQPILQVAVMLSGVAKIVIFNSRPSGDGRQPCLMVSPNSAEAYLVGGAFGTDRAIYRDAA
jgi:hypothetical protein